MLASTLPLTISQSIAKAPATAKGGSDGPVAGSDTFARELGLAQARGAAAPRPAVPQAVTRAAPGAAPPAPARQAPLQAAPERSTVAGHDNGRMRPTAKETEAKRPAGTAGTPPTTSTGARPGRISSAAHGDPASKAPAADTAQPASGSDEAPPGSATTEATPAGDLASMVASLLGLDGPAQASGLPAQGPDGQPTGSTAAGLNGKDVQAGVALTANGVGAGADALMRAGAAALSGSQGSAKLLDKDAADPAAGGAVALALPTTAELAAAATVAAAQTAAQAAGRTESRSITVSADTMAAVAAAAPLTPASAIALAGSVPQPALGATARQDGAAAPFDAQLAAALGSPEFAPALGHQVSLLVRGGVQEARLHLNPAEMGPITVQIALDGQTAQINLAAEQPLTRQMLEQAMPALASALREGGLTLTGGGVFEQPRDPRQGDPEARPASSFAAAGGTDDAPAMPAASVRTLRGAVDLIA